LSDEPLKVLFHKDMRERKLLSEPAKKA
jgi:hypothetical protein